MRNLPIAILVLICVVTALSGQRKANSEEAAPCKPGAVYQSGCYARIIDSLPTAGEKTKYLGRVADALQTQLNDLKADMKLQHDLESSDSQSIRLLERQIDLIRPQADPAATYLEQQRLKEDLLDIKKEFGDFRDAVCPAIATAKLEAVTKSRLEHVCGLR
jgi:hypothetical protein